jgi:hypothetical protein
MSESPRFLGCFLITREKDGESAWGLTSSYLTVLAGERGERRSRSRFNQGVHSVQTNPNKTKQDCLVFLGFIRPNRYFSKGYEQKNKKNRLASQVACKTSQAASNLILSRCAAMRNLRFRSSE